MESKSLNRRQACKRLLLGVVLLPNLVTSLRGFAESAATPKAFKMIDPEKNKVAKSLGYTPDHTKASGKTMAEAKCFNCQMYKKKGEVDGNEVGTCNMIGGGYVTANGWCKSWTKNASAMKKS